MRPLERYRNQVVRLRRITKYLFYLTGATLLLALFNERIPLPYNVYFVVAFLFLILFTWFYLFALQWLKRRSILNPPPHADQMIVNGRVVSDESYFKSLARQGTTKGFLIQTSVLAIIFFGLLVLLVILLRAILFAG
jgi:hypothetical protein